MIVRTRSIPEEGLDVEFAIPVEVLKGALPKDDEIRDALNEPVDCHLHLEMQKKDVFLSGDAVTSIHPVCNRCAEEFQQPLQVDLMLTCSPREVTKGRKVEGDSYQESDEGIIFFDKQELDLTEIVREQILLAIPIKQLCKEDCQGLCVRCGMNLNQGSHQCAAKTQH